MAAIQPSVETSIASLDDMVASFRAPAIAAGEEVAWPEEPIAEQLADQTLQLIHDTQPRQPSQTISPVPTVSPQQSALELLAGTTRQSDSQVSQISSIEATPLQEQNEDASQMEVREEFPQTKMAPRISLFPHLSLRLFKFTRNYKKKRRHLGGRHLL